MEMWPWPCHEAFLPRGTLQPAGGGEADLTGLGSIQSVTLKRLGRGIVKEVFGRLLAWSRAVTEIQVLWTGRSGSEGKTAQMRYGRTRPGPELLVLHGEASDGSAAM